MSNTVESQRAANRRAALNDAARYLDNLGLVFPDYAAWVDEVTALAERLLPWLNADLEETP